MKLRAVDKIETGDRRVIEPGEIVTERDFSKADNVEALVESGALVPANADREIRSSDRGASKETKA